MLRILPVNSLLCMGKGVVTSLPHPAPLLLKTSADYSPVETDNSGMI